jgi:DNA polymerase-3 subunit gamma/tau
VSENFEKDDISYARQYRPSTLDGYIGNDRVKETVVNLLSKGNYPQSILLEGNTGCGKTTLSRIVTSWYTCEDKKEDGSPCGECVTCGYMKEYIRTGKNEMLSDIQEIDTSDKSGKHDMDSLLEEIEYPAYGGGWKVYILDECHAMSQGAATRLLKVLEEPPEKVLIIFCTTEPQKMLDTLKNRCQLKLKIVKPTLKELGSLLIGVCNREGVEYDSEGVRMICSRSDFVIRDALNNIERVIKTRGNALGTSVSDEFLEISDNIIFDFYDAYLDGNDFMYINVLYRIKTTYNFKDFMQALLNFTIRGVYVVNSIPVEGLSELEMKTYKEVFSKFTLPELSGVLERLLNINSKSTNIEASLIAFMYSVNEKEADLNIEDSKNEQGTFKRTPKSKTVENSIVEDRGVVGLGKEREFRDQNIKNLEQRSLNRGIESVKKSSSDVVDFGDVLNLFEVEKVRG